MRKPKPQTTITVFAEKIEGSDRARYAGSEQMEADYLVGEVSYSKGGVNYWSGGYTKRGYRFMVQMRTRGAGFESFTIGGGIAKGEFIEEAKMFSAKRLQALSTDATILGRILNLKAECLAIYRAKHPQVEPEPALDSVDCGERAMLMAIGG